MESWKPLRSSSLFAVVDRFRVYYVGIIGKLALALNSMSSLGQISAMRQNLKKRLCCNSAVLTS